MPDKRKNFLVKEITDLFIHFDKLENFFKEKPY